MGPPIEFLIIIGLIAFVANFIGFMIGFSIVHIITKRYNANKNKWKDEWDRLLNDNPETGGGK